MDATSTPSPFLPGTNIQYAWDSTSLGYIKTCPRLYQYIMIDGWAPKGDESVHLRFGIEYHKALQDFDIYRAKGIKHNNAVRLVLQDLLMRTENWKPDEETRAGKYKNRRTLVRTVLWYFEHFRDDPAKTVIKDDGQPAVELSFRFELDFSPNGSQPYILSGHLDRVVRFNDELYVMDRKTTTTTLTPYYFAKYEPDNQMSIYTIAARVIFDTPIRGVIIDAAQVMVNAARFVRGFTYRTGAQSDEFLNDLEYWFNVAESYAQAGYWPMNDTACDKYGGCRFRDICSKSPQVREQFLKSSFEQVAPEERWNPLKARE